MKTGAYSRYLTVSPRRHFDLYKFLFKEGELKEIVSSRIDENLIFLSNPMFISRVELQAKHRGKGFAAKAIRQVVRSLGSSCNLIVCKPFPLQYEG